jgi:excisionase family DNA binding protein
VSIAQAAELLGVDRSRVSHRLAQGTLWAFAMGRVRRIPCWQFTAEDLLLPGLPVVVAAIPDGLSPVILEAFMRAPLAELGGIPPIEYLTTGGNPALVAEFVAALGEW